MSQELARVKQELQQQLTTLQAQLANQLTQANNNNGEEINCLKQRIQELESDLSLQKSLAKDLETELQAVQAKLFIWEDRFYGNSAQQVGEEWLQAKLERNSFEFQLKERKEDVNRLNKESQMYLNAYKKVNKVLDNKIEHISRLEKQVRALGATPVLQAQIELNNN